MKKLLGISLVAVLAATPLMAGAETTAVTATQPVAASTEAEITAATTTVQPKYKLKDAAGTDGNAASAGYVKGAYNAAIKAINKVDSRIDTVAEGKQDALTEGDGIDITKDNQTGLTTIKVDVTSNKGLAFDASAHTLEIKDGDGIKTGANGVEVDLTTDGGLQIDANHQLGVKAGDGITVDSTGVKLTNGIQNAGDTTTYTGTGLTTKGYVDEAVAGINTNITNNLATKTGVATTIKNTDITVTPTTTNLIVMTDWADDTTNSTTAVVTGVSAAIDPNTVSYTETLRTRS